MMGGDEIRGDLGRKNQNVYIEDDDKSKDY